MCWYPWQRRPPTRFLRRPITPPTASCTSTSRKCRGTSPWWRRSCGCTIGRGDPPTWTTTYRRWAFHCGIILCEFVPVHYEHKKYIYIQTWLHSPNFNPRSALSLFFYHPAFLLLFLYLLLLRAKRSERQRASGASFSSLMGTSRKAVSRKRSILDTWCW